MVSKSRVESVRCEECGEQFCKGVFEEDLRCSSCISTKYHDVFSYQINLNDRSVWAVLFSCVLVALACVLSPCNAWAVSTPIPDAVAYECLCGEACNQGIVGMMAVGEVLRVRGSTKGVYGCKTGLYSKAPEYVKRQVREAWSNSATSNFTHKADHFENVGKFGKPKWADSMTKTVTIKSHTFYKSRG